MLLAARLLRAFCSRRRPAWRVHAAYGLLLLSPLVLEARKPPPAPGYERAQALHGAFEALPEPQRTRAAYERVLDAYRDVYRNDPFAPKADASALTVAQLLTDEGRHFADQTLLLD